MKLFDVYPLFEIEPVKAQGTKVWDKEGIEYLDLYGGHAVISIGHSHPHYVTKINDQLKDLAFYSNSVQNELQRQYANLLEEVAEIENYELYLCSTGAEAIENALKVASFATSKSRVIAMGKSFHGRTSGAVAATDNPKIVAPFNRQHEVTFVPLNNSDALAECMSEEVAAVIIEGIQGVAGIFEPNSEFLQTARALCDHFGAKLILDEVQSGFGRSGEFFAFQHHQIRPDIITMAKGMGNGFPLAGILIDQSIEPWLGMLGTTFGGNHLACSAGIAVLEVISKEGLIGRSRELGEWLKSQLQEMEGVQEVRGSGLMLGIDLGKPVKDLRHKLLYSHKIFTGSAADPNTLRLLPPMNVSQSELTIFLKALKSELS